MSFHFMYVEMLKRWMFQWTYWNEKCLLESTIILPANSQLEAILQTFAWMLLDRIEDFFGSGWKWRNLKTQKQHAFRGKYRVEKTCWLRTCYQTKLLMLTCLYGSETWISRRPSIKSSALWGASATRHLGFLKFYETHWNSKSQPIRRRIRHLGAKQKCLPKFRRATRMRVKPKAVFFSFAAGNKKNGGSTLVTDCLAEVGLSWMKRKQLFWRVKLKHLRRYVRGRVDLSKFWKNTLLRCLQPRGQPNHKIDWQYMQYHMVQALEACHANRWILQNRSKSANAYRKSSSHVGHWWSAQRHIILQEWKLQAEFMHGSSRYQRASASVRSSQTLTLWTLTLGTPWRITLGPHVNAPGGGVGVG